MESEPEADALADAEAEFELEVECEVDLDFEVDSELESARVVWSGKPTRESARSRAAVACMMKWRTLHQGVTRTNHAISGFSGRIEISEHAAWRQSVAISVRSFARCFTS